MSGRYRRLIAASGLALAIGAPASGQTRVTVYPVFVWVPTSISIEVNLPPVDIGGGGGTGIVGKIVDPRFDGAYFGGLAIDHGPWRIEGDGLWAAVGGDREARPQLKVDLDAIYGHASLGRRVFGNMYVTAGVRRFALKYVVKLEGRDDFTRKPGLWDPLIGVAYHRVGTRLELHGSLEGGGFGVGSDSEWAASFKADWKPVRHFGIAAGYSLLKLNFSHDVANRTFDAKQTLHGPVAGIGLYF